MSRVCSNCRYKIMAPVGVICYSNNSNNIFMINLGKEGLVAAISHGKWFRGLQMWLVIVTKCRMSRQRSLWGWKRSIRIKGTTMHNLFKDLVHQVCTNIQINEFRSDSYNHTSKPKPSIADLHPNSIEDHPQFRPLQKIAKWQPACSKTKPLTS